MSGRRERGLVRTMMQAMSYTVNRDMVIRMCIDREATNCCCVVSQSASQLRRDVGRASGCNFVFKHEVSSMPLHSLQM